MKKYGLLPKNLPQDALIDVCATDRAYWRPLWWQPTVSARRENLIP